jgi:branched-subunit amino acid aminotransferase/4-amino-4-deoxychorismate lyase
LVGDRVTFTKQGQNYIVLENLNLERVVKTIEENRTVTDADTLEWTVDGTVTEFRGANFVLITRSVLVARPRGTGATP